MGSPLSTEMNMPMILKITILSVMPVLTLDATSHLHDNRHALRKFSAASEGLSALILCSGWRRLVVTSMVEDYILLNMFNLQQNTVSLINFYISNIQLIL